MSHTPEEYLGIHASLTEELRHSDGTIWQFAIAVAALEEGVVALSDQGAFHGAAGKIALAAGFMLSACLSFVLLRHTYERRRFAYRLRVVEDELSKAYPKVFVPSGGRQWFAPMLLAWFLLLESTAGFVLFAYQLYGR